MRGSKVDANHAAIVQALRDVGASVQSLAEVGKGCPDILAGFRGVNFVLEVKRPDAAKKRRELDGVQRAWHDGWRGSVHVVLSVDDALRVIGSVS